MNQGSPYGWLFFAALGLGLFLSSLVRKERSRIWLMAGFSLFLLALGGAFIFTDFIVSDFIAERLIPFYLPITAFFFVVSLRLAVLPSTLILLFSLIPLIWGTSGVYSLEEGIYPAKVTCYPDTVAGRSYHVVYSDGRESSVTGCGDYLVVERISWDWRLFFLTPREFPVGFNSHDSGDEPSAGGEGMVRLTMKMPTVTERPGMRRDLFLVGPIENDRFYSWWLIRNYRGEVVLTSQNPGSLSQP